MDFNLTEEQRMIQNTVRRYLKDSIVPIADAYDRKGPMKKDDAHRFLKELKQFGYVGTLIKKELGGPGLSHLDGAILYENLNGAYASLGGVVGITSSLSHWISQSENVELRDCVLPGLLSGDKIACMAITEPNVGSNASAIETKAVLNGDHYTIDGTKMWISNGSISDYVVVVATIDRSVETKGIIQLLVEREVSPFEAREIKKMGFRSFPISELIFENCRVPRENVLMPAGGGFDKLLRALTRARCDAAIASVGVAQAATDAAVRYATQRTQFGKPIGKFQLIQEIVADMVAEVEASRLLTYRAFFVLDQGGTGRKEGSIAKAFATEAGVRVTSKAMQIHGAYGFSEEYPVERYFRDSRCYTIPDGTTEIQKLIVGREVLGISAFD